MLNEQYPSYLKNFTRSAITVALLDGNRQTLAYDKTTKLSSLFEITCEYCDIDKDNLFGFAVLIDDYYAFLDLNTKVCKINFKDYYKKSQKNVLFKKLLQRNDSCSPVHNASTNSASRRNSANNSTVILNNSKSSTHFFTKHTNNKFNQSTHSAPVNSQSSLALDHRSQYWMNSDVSNSVSGAIPRIHFRVKSYVSPHCLRDRTTKLLYFQQLLKNVLEYRLLQNDETYLRLAAYALHAHYCHQDNTAQQDSESSELAFEPRKFVPQHILEKFGVDWLCRNLPQLRTHLCPPGAVSRLQAVNFFISLAASSNFNQHLCPVAFISTTSVQHPPLPNQPHNHLPSSTKKHWLGLSPQGLELHVMNLANTHPFLLVHQTTLKWSDIHRISHKKACVVCVYLDPPRHSFYRRLKLHTETRMQGEHLVWLSRHMHVCQKAAALSATQTQDSLLAAEREQYTEKYVYIDNQDRMLHEEIQGEPIKSVISPQSANHNHSFPDSANQIALPVTSTPAVPARRAGSKARPKLMKEILSNTNNTRDAAVPPSLSSTSQDVVKKQAQYIKKGQHQQQQSYGRVVSSDTAFSITVPPPPPTAVYSMMFCGDNGDDEDDGNSCIQSPGARRLPRNNDDGNYNGSSVYGSENDPGRSPGEESQTPGRFISLTGGQFSSPEIDAAAEEDVNSETDPGLSIPSPPLHPGGGGSPFLSSGSSSCGDAPAGCYHPVYAEKTGTNLKDQRRLWRSENMLHLNQWSSVSSDDDDNDDADNHDSIEISSISS